MKKLIALAMVILMLVSVVACNKADDNNAVTSDTTNALTSDPVQSENEDTTEKVKESYTGTFKTGFGRVDITSTISASNPISFQKNTFTKVKDPNYVTCIAVNDGKNTVLIITADVKEMFHNVYEIVAKRISTSTQVPVSNIVISATHCHNALTPTAATGSDIGKNLIKWTNEFYAKTIDACKMAIDDLSDSKIQTGTFKTTGMAFVRRYIKADGGFADIHSGVTNAVAYESEADDTAQLIRFTREDKKDILMINWQCHVASAEGAYPGTITSDIVYYFRELETQNDDLLCAYYQGASGNINTNAKVAGTGKFISYIMIGRELAKRSLETLDKMTPAEAGKIEAKRDTFSGKIRKDSAERVAQAKEAQKDSSLMSKYGFASTYDVNAVVNRSVKGETQSMYLNTITFGDLAFASIPYEMFDTNGKELKEGSPYDMTFVLTCSNGSHGYVPSALAVPHGGYEVYKSYFEYGTAEKVVEHVLGMLNN